MRTCIFCDNRASTKEHIWPRWLMSIIDPEDKGYLEGERAGVTYPPRRSKELISKFICPSCNNGWMSQLETLAIPIIESLLNKNAVSLNSKNQKLLVLWSIKTVMVLETQSKSAQCFNQLDRQNFKQTLEPPSSTFIWIAECINFQGAYSDCHNLRDSISHIPIDINASVFTMAFNSLSIQIGRFILPKHESHLSTFSVTCQSEFWDNITHQIWPSEQDNIYWPPKSSLNGEEEINEFSKRWIYKE